MSAGESVEVTLPRNEVELNAFVLPTPPPGKTTMQFDVFFEQVLRLYCLEVN